MQVDSTKISVDEKEDPFKDCGPNIRNKLILNQNENAISAAPNAVMERAKCRFF